MSCIISHGSYDSKTNILLNVVAFLAYFWVTVPFFCRKKCVVLRKSACPSGKKSEKAKNALAGESGLVLMSNPATKHTVAGKFEHGPNGIHDQTVG